MNRRTIQILANSQHEFSELLQNLDQLRNKNDPNMTKHKRISGD